MVLALVGLLGVVREVGLLVLYLALNNSIPFCVVLIVPFCVVLLR